MKRSIFEVYLRFRYNLNILMNKLKYFKSNRLKVLCYDKKRF